MNGRLQSGRLLETAAVMKELLSTLDADQSGRK